MEAYASAYLKGPENVNWCLQQLGWKTHWIHISSTGVFSQNNGEWVHEKTQPTPQTARSKILYQSEQIALSSKKASVIRMGGIYGNGRNALIRMTQSADAVQSSPPQFTNRIHETDAVRAIAFLASRMRNPSESIRQHIFHCVDYYPAAKQEVMQYICQQHHWPEKPTFINKSPDALTTQNKRVGNRKLAQMGFEFLYPSFYDGYAH